MSGSLSPSASGGTKTHRTLSAASVNATNVKASKGTVYGILASNVNAAARFLKLYDKATAPDENDTPKMTILLRASGLESFQTPLGIEFTSGIGFRLTTGVADNDTGAVAANEHVVHIFYG